MVTMATASSFAQSGKAKKFVQVAGEAVDLASPEVGYRPMCAAETDWTEETTQKPGDAVAVAWGEAAGVEARHSPAPVARPKETVLRLPRLGASVTLNAVAWGCEKSQVALQPGARAVLPGQVAAAAERLALPSHRLSWRRRTGDACRECAPENAMFRIVLQFRLAASTLLPVNNASKE